jgi:hypothetical protein
MSFRNPEVSQGSAPVKPNNGFSSVMIGVGSTAANGTGAAGGARTASAGPPVGSEFDGPLPGTPGAPPLTEQDLPPPNTKRWVMRRKAEVVAGVRCGLISLDEACRRYTLSVEEFLSWQRLIDSHGVRGLRATRLQDYRSGPGGERGDDDGGLAG